MSKISGMNPGMAIYPHLISVPTVGRDAHQSLVEPPGAD
jgi:hypothetical protein